MQPEIALTFTAWKISVFAVILVRIFPHSYWIRTRITPNRDFFYAALEIQKLDSFFKHYLSLAVKSFAVLQTKLSFFVVMITRLNELKMYFFQAFQMVIWNPRKSKFGTFRKLSLQNRNRSLILSRCFTENRSLWIMSDFHESVPNQTLILKPINKETLLHSIF